MSRPPQSVDGNGRRSIRWWRRALAQVTATGPLVFVSYRRDDTGGHARLLADHLQQRYGSGRVFFDVESVEAGSGPWRDQLSGQLSRCRVVVAVVGPGWTDQIATRADRGVEDPVRYELTTTRELGRPVVGARVGRADPPSELPDDLAWFQDEHLIEVVPGQEEGGNRQVCAAVDRNLPITARRWVRQVAIWVAGVVAAILVSVTVLRWAQPCRFERCLPSFALADSTVLVAPGIELDADDHPTSSAVASRLVDDLAAGLGRRLGDETVVYRLDADQLDVGELGSDRDASESISTIAEVLDRSRADLLITTMITRSGASDVANRTEYRSDVYLGQVRDAEDLRGRRLEFAAFATDVLFDIERTDDEELIALASERLEAVVGLLDTMHDYEVRHFDDALAGFGLLLADAPATADAAVIHQLRGNVRIELGELDGASDDYQSAHALDPTFTRASLGLAEVELLRALGNRCERSGTVLTALETAAAGYEDALANGLQRADPILQVKALVGLGRTEACRSLIHTGGSPATEAAIGDHAGELFERARSLVDSSDADLLRETLAAAGLGEARLALRRADLAASVAELDHDAELDRAAQLLDADGGVIARTNRRWVVAQAHELLALVDHARADDDGAADERRMACRDHQRVIDDAPGASLVEQSRAALVRLGCAVPSTS